MKNQREIYEALLAGETLINDALFTVKMKEDGSLKYDETRIWGGVFNAVFRHVEDWQIYKEPKWYESIPDGDVLCWVRKNDYAANQIRIIDGVDDESYVDRYGEYWIFATPLTEQEIQVFMDNAPE